MPVLSTVKKGFKKLKGRKSSGNKGHPGTNRNKAVRSKYLNIDPQKMRKYAATHSGKKGANSAQNITSEVYRSADDNIQNDKNKTAVTTNQVAAIGNLTKGNGKLAALLQNATGSTSLLDWANFFRAIPRDQQAQIIAESRTDDKLDDSPSTIQKIKQYAMDAAGIYARATGNDINTGEVEAAAMAAKEKQKTNTMFIVGAVIITVLIVVAVLFRSPGKKYV